MCVMIATDAWQPQVNGVVRTLQSLAANLRNLDVDVEFLTPEGFRSVAVPTYPSLRVAIPNAHEIVRRIEACRPELIHIATEGPIGTHGTGLLHKATPELHHVLRDALSGICFGADADPDVVDLRGAALVP